MPSIPRPPSQALFGEKVEWGVARIAAPWAWLQRMEVYVATLFEILFIVGSQYPDLNAHLPKVVAQTPNPVISWTTTTLRLIGILTQIAGSWIRIICHRYLGTAFTWNIYGTKPRDATLVTSGPYSFVRHPSYTGRLMGYLGITTYFLLPGSFVRESGVLHTWIGRLALAFWLWSALTINVMLVVTRPGVEDAELKKRFRREWERWSERVRWKVIPGVW
ncbi:hypothetical protein AAF712_010362 [Marasmius tenuissimus]|uniref:Protein-S-isoprenylcysteine O-methyltransferase n=1 Tax=Marasmius tenuissimus TaxID=585030 RepID=A0ABR2ZN47_9AGAR